ncbi:AI-2E family transporter [Butyrivibrio sp. M55]|uniref:AI-2E family transporter n=1 Tax=Butyrivibrio sp. M55 TaxID=1855323 RepID=UPI0008E01890|nr:AI-2E family transporter [Butyrivibrio sp. M55]SFU78645.1 Predicted PurR-regulated permease PerM [Butyrivibrio sp. M55]
MKLDNKWIKKKWVSYTIATCSAVVLYMVLANFPSILKGINSFFSFLRPVILGIVIAYIFNPVALMFERGLFKKIKKESRRWKLSVAFTIFFILLAVVLLFVALVPQLIDSVSKLISSIGEYVDPSNNFLKDLENNKIVQLIGIDLTALESFEKDILGIIGGYFSENMGSLVNGSLNAGRGMFDLVLAFIFAIYFLLDNRRLIRGFSKFLSLAMNEKTYKRTCDVTDRCNTILIRYISFDIIDGIIVGFANLIYMLIAGQPYSVLISVIVGVTNLAPTFGPIVGGAIGAFILVLENPWYALWFIVFTIILQTIDGYILKPRLFGESLGVSPLMILVAIVLGGRKFGVIGIVLAIPFAAIIDFIWKDYVIKKLEEKHSQRYNI